MPHLPLLVSERRARGLSQAGLAQAAGISVPTLRGLERGRGTTRSLVQVMAVLGLAWGWMPLGSDPLRRIVARRQEIGMSQADMARRAGCARGTIIDLEQDFGGNVTILLSVLSVLGLRPALRKVAAGGKGGLVPQRNAPERDRVMTPPDLAAAIIGHFADQMTGVVLDPARGQGAFFSQLPKHVAPEWCELSEGRDFLDWSQPVDWIITNPPWSRLREFTCHAMTLAPNIIWLAPLTNLTTKARLRDMEMAGFGIAEILKLETPKVWPQSGFQLAAVHLRQGHEGDCRFTRLKRTGE